MDLTITIPNDKINEFKTGFLKANPVPENDDGTPAMTELQWLKSWIVGRLKAEYVMGKRRIAFESATVVVDDGVVV